MTEDIYFKRVMTSVLLIVLVVLSFFLVKPILMSIITGILLAFVFNIVTRTAVKPVFMIPHYSGRSALRTHIPPSDLTLIYNVIIITYNR